MASMPPMGSPMGSMNMGGWGGASAYGDPMGFGGPPMGGSMSGGLQPYGDPMQGFGGIGGNNQNAQQQYQAYGWNPQSLPMNWGGPYGPLSWPSYNQMSMNAGGLYGSMFNPWLMLQGGSPNQPPSQGGGTTAPTPTATPPPVAPPQISSPHFANVGNVTGSAVANPSPAYNQRSLMDNAFRQYIEPTKQYQHNAALGRGMPGRTWTGWQGIQPGPGWTTPA